MIKYIKKNYLLFASDFKNIISESFEFFENIFLCEETQNYISKYYVCDGVVDCLFGEDEMKCQKQMYFQCATLSKLIPIHNLCDFFFDCSDMSDEKFCC